MTQRIIDLTLPVRDGMRGVRIEPHTHVSTHGFTTSNYHLYSHSGTHMDAPLHFLQDGNTIDRLDLTDCVGDAVLVDCSQAQPNQVLEPAELAGQAKLIALHRRVLIRTDWDKHAENETWYRENMPRLSPALAHWLVAHGVRLIGLETPSVASLRPEHKAELAEVHQILLRAGMVIVESLSGLRHVRGTVVHFVALPLKIVGRDGSPVRAIAIEEAA